MTIQNDPDAIRADIERSRAALSHDVDALADTANPKHIAGRKVDQVKGAARSMREYLMGAPDDPHDSGRFGDASDTLTDKASELKAGVQNAPQQTRRKATGNPLAAGLIAFGVGYLISSAIPSTERERDAAQRLQKSAEPLKETLSETAQDLGDRLREPAQHAMDSVKASVGEAVGAVRQEGEAAKDDVTERPLRGETARGSGMP